LKIEQIQKKMQNILRREKQSTFSGVMRKRHVFKNTVDHVVIDIPSGFHVAQFNDGFIRKDFFIQPKGINCQNKECGLGTSILFGSKKICPKCYNAGYSKTSKRGSFSLYCPIRSITLIPVMLIGRNRKKKSTGRWGHYNVHNARNSVEHHLGVGNFVFLQTGTPRRYRCTLQYPIYGQSKKMFKYLKKILIFF
jgi:hypothetical protein